MRRILIMCLLILLVGCSTIKYYQEGIVSHSDSLEEASDKCWSKCEEKYPYGRVTPRLTECTEKECQCEC